MGLTLVAPTVRTGKTTGSLGARLVVDLLILRMDLLELHLIRAQKIV